MCDYEDPERVAHCREIAEWGEFEVSILKDGHKIGTLDESFSNDYDATVAANRAEIPDVGITASVDNASNQGHASS